MSRKRENKIEQKISGPQSGEENRIIVNPKLHYKNFPLKVSWEWVNNGSGVWEMTNICFDDMMIRLDVKKFKKITVKLTLKEDMRMRLAMKNQLDPRNNILVAYQFIEIDNILKSEHKLGYEAYQIHKKCPGTINLAVGPMLEMEFLVEKFQKSKFCASDLFLNETCSDVKIHCHGRIFPCHKNILVVRSKYFEMCLMNSGMRESESGIIEIEDFSPEVVESLLKYIYTNEIEEDEISIDLLMATDKYDLGKVLKDICVIKLKSNLTIQNAVEVLAKSYQIGCKDLKKSAVKFIKENQGKIVPSETYHEIFLQALGSIFLDTRTKKSKKHKHKHRHKKHIYKK